MGLCLAGGWGFFTPLSVYEVLIVETIIIPTSSGSNISSPALDIALSYKTINSTIIAENTTKRTGITKSMAKSYETLCLQYRVGLGNDS